MELTEKYSIEKESHGFSLVEKTVIEVVKDGKKTGEQKEGAKKKYYASVSKALQGFLDCSVDDLDDYDIIPEIALILRIIDDAKVWIKKEFCIEVKKC